MTMTADNTQLTLADGAVPPTEALVSAALAWRHTREAAAAAARTAACAALPGLARDPEELGHDELAASLPCGGRVVVRLRGLHALNVDATDLPYDVARRAVNTTLGTGYFTLRPRGTSDYARARHGVYDEWDEDRGVSYLLTLDDAGAHLELPALPPTAGLRLLRFLGTASDLSRHAPDTTIASTDSGTGSSGSQTKAQPTCEHGSPQSECSEIDPCELGAQAEDAEAEVIEQSLGLR